jgi:hypothetical protein
VHQSNQLNHHQHSAPSQASTQNSTVSSPDLTPLPAGAIGFMPSSFVTPPESLNSQQQQLIQQQFNQQLNQQQSPHHNQVLQGHTTTV